MLNKRNSLIDEFYQMEKIYALQDILQTTILVKEFKSLYVKHAFDNLGPILKDLYESENEHLKQIKSQYKENYELRVS